MFLVYFCKRRRRQKNLSQLLGVIKSFPKRNEYLYYCAYVCTKTKCNFFYVTNRTFQKSIFLVKSPLDISAADEDRDHIEQASAEYIWTWITLQKLRSLSFDEIVLRNAFKICWFSYPRRPSINDITHFLRFLTHSLPLIAHFTK